jgi:hypothetical protein
MPAVHSTKRDTADSNLPVQIIADIIRAAVKAHDPSFEVVGVSPTVITWSPSRCHADDASTQAHRLLKTQPEGTRRKEEGKVPLFTSPQVRTRSPRVARCR